MFSFDVYIDDIKCLFDSFWLYHTALRKTNTTKASKSSNLQHYRKKVPSKYRRNKKKHDNNFIFEETKAEEIINGQEINELKQFSEENYVPQP